MHRVFLLLEIQGVENAQILPNDSNESRNIIDIEAIDDFIFLSPVPDLNNLDISFRSSIFNDVEENKENSFNETRESANIQLISPPNKNLPLDALEDTENENEIDDNNTPTSLNKKGQV